EVSDDVTVVHDLAAHVDRALEAVEGEVHDLDRPDDPGAEAARGGEEDRLDGQRRVFGNHLGWDSIAARRGAPRAALRRALPAASPALPDRTTGARGGTAVSRGSMRRRTARRARRAAHIPRFRRSARRGPTPSSLVTPPAPGRDQIGQDL